jgi:hypothetical protein
VVASEHIPEDPGLPTVVASRREAEDPLVALVEDVAEGPGLLSPDSAQRDALCSSDSAYFNFEVVRRGIDESDPVDERRRWGQALGHQQEGHGADDN